MRHLPDLDSLQLLMRIAATGSLTRAGQQHGLGQPAVSARLRALERQVGMPLVERTARGSRLTSAGVLVTDWAREMVKSASSLDAGLASLQRGEQQWLTIAASMTVAEHLVPAWLAGLARRHPGVSMRLEAMNSAEVPEALATGGADLGFVEGPETSPQLAERDVAADELVLVVAPSHPWARRRPRTVTQHELARSRLVQRNVGAAPRQALEQALEHARSDEGSMAAPLAEFSTNHALVEAALTGWAPAVLSDLDVDADLAAGTLVEIRVRGLQLRRRLRAVWRTDVPLPALAAELVDLAASHHERRRRLLRQRPSAT